MIVIIALWIPAAMLGSVLVRSAGRVWARVSALAAHDLRGQLDERLLAAPGRLSRRHGNMTS
jgi:hypothetical protein